MNVTIKTSEEQDKMRVAGSLAAEVLDMIGEHVQPGVTTDELDRICHKYITETLDAVPAPLNYRGFPKSICTSVNHVVCHGIPGERKLKSGDILVCEMTMPAWTPLFSTVAAVVADTGGRLSHCAIVSREYGLPCVVGTAVGTAVLEDGMLVTVRFR